MVGGDRGGPAGPWRIIAELDQEWAAISSRTAEVGCWASRRPALEHCRDLAEVLAAVRANPDAVLGALLSESVRGSQLAARTVLQAMLGKVVLMARADDRVGPDSYLVAMWECIHRYPIDRRPAHIAANLALDARKLARRDDGPARTAPWPPGREFAQLVDRRLLSDRLDHGRDVSVLTAGDVIRAALELELIDTAASSLLIDVYARGLTSRDAARRHETSPGMVRRRCSDAVGVLARHSAELAGHA